jgi:hypothetical protein
MQVWRNDRFGRGGDHTEFLNAGYPAVRLSVAVENYNYQHQDLRVENGVEFGDTIDKMDFPYLARVTKLNIAALAWLASAPPPPEPTAEGAVSTDTTVKWNAVSGAARYSVRWRRTDSAQWTGFLPAADSPIMVMSGGSSGTHKVDGMKHEVVIQKVRVDDWMFGVSSVSKDGFESPVASAVPGGAFKPWVKPEEKKD